MAFPLPPLDFFLKIIYSVSWHSYRTEYWRFYAFMIIFWSIKYSIIYSIAGKISGQIGSLYKITAFALLVFLCVSFIALLKSNRADLWRIKLPSAKNLITTLPLLILPVVNICLLFFLPQRNMTSLNIWNLLTVTFAAAFEELLFRGYLLVLLSHIFRKNMLPAAAANSVIFGGFHFLNMISGGDFYITLLQVICAISVSFAFVFVTVKTDSIFPCIIVHCLINASSVPLKESVLNAETIVAYAAVSAFYILYGITLYCMSLGRKGREKE